MASVLLFLMGFTATAQRIATELVCDWQTLPPKSTYLSAAVTPLGAHRTLLTFRDSSSAARAYAHLAFRPQLVTVQYNYRVAFRRLPDDPLYGRQPNLARMGFPEAWEHTTGGTLVDGTPLVTAVLDSGFDTDHEDLRDNLWTNPAEVAGDGLDNDGNGYVDDLHGWNFADGLGEHPADEHGTQVAGILAGRGDNGLGIAGTNWQQQLMVFTIRTVADIVAAYDYVADQRRRWQESGGQAGALVVATNASFGLSRGRCSEDYPVWAAAYDELAELGILTAVSVANQPDNVDQLGDMPASCSSEAIVAVTNVGTDDRLHPAAAYGSVSVDLGAMGQGSYGTRPADRYGSFGSTSAAAPYVTGAIGLLYATPCPALLRQVRQQPRAAAARIRQALLQTVRPNEDLTGVTVSGGTLDVAAAQQYLLTTCEEDAAVLRVQDVYPNPSGDRVWLLTNRYVLDGLHLEVVDVFGRVFSPAASPYVASAGAGWEWSVRGWPAGVYYVRIRGEASEYIKTLVVR